MTMSGEPSEMVKKNSDYDPISRCSILNGIAKRYHGLAENILEEIKSAGFKIKSWERENENDDLNAVATKY